MAPSTPPPPRRLVLAALTMASTGNRVMSPSATRTRIEIGLLMTNVICRRRLCNPPRLQDILKCLGAICELLRRDPHLRHDGRHQAQEFPFFGRQFRGSVRRRVD